MMKDFLTTVLSKLSSPSKTSNADEPPAAARAPAMTDEKTDKKTDKKTAAKRDKQLVSSSADVSAFLTKVAALPKGSGDGRLVFALDATASRQSTWDHASHLQAQMFSEAAALGGLALQLCYFRGFGEFFASNWQSDADSVLSIMQGLRCEAGRTQIGAVLKHALRENAVKPLSCVVYVGDCLEEDIDILADLAGKLGLLKVPLFIFQEGGDPAAMAGFKELSRLSGGAYSRFDSASAAQLAHLLRAVAAYAAGGLKALTAFGARNKDAAGAVALLERQIRR